MSRKTKVKPVYRDLRPVLEPFIPLLVQQNADVKIEAATNKAFHMGRKEYEYVATVAGHEPVNDKYGNNYGCNEAQSAA